MSEEPAGQLAPRHRRRPDFSIYPTGRDWRPLWRWCAGVLALLAVATVIIAFTDRPNAANWVAGTGGIGALAFGAIQLLQAADAKQAVKRRARSLAGVVRRSIVEMANRSDGQPLGQWITQIGEPRSLDPVLESLRELQGLTAELGPPLADHGDMALSHFLSAADDINPLVARGPIHSSLSAQFAEERARILGQLISVAERLERVQGFAPAGPQIRPAVLAEAKLPFLARLGMGY